MGLVSCFEVSLEPNERDGQLQRWSTTSCSLISFVGFGHSFLSAVPDLPPFAYSSVIKALRGLCSYHLFISNDFGSSGAGSG